MSIFTHLAKHDRKRFVAVRKGLQKANREFSDQLVEIDNKAVAESSQATSPIRAWRSRRFLVQLYDKDCQLRLSACKTSVRNDGHWEDGISWDELMDLKRQAGFGDWWAVEIYPPDEAVVNVANMRHLWLVDAPAFAWNSTPETQPT